ncbi:MAG TPA: YkgJ family cysteine cluster protein [Candidatus Nitrosotalea sp.]|nr:YkgJ family cysteine cluster protein [Candidatus Nitrosotalea sp.]
MMQNKIEESLEMLSKDWKIEPIIRDFILGKKTDVSDFQTKVNGVIFHIPYLPSDGGYVIWKCYWPDCHNCCNRQGRLPLTSSDLITISKNLKYEKVSDFVKNETNVNTWEEHGPAGNSITMTMINLKRKTDETEAEDGTHIRCRFLDDKGYCGLHPSRPGVCYLYPFSSWLENEKGKARVHATFQFTGDCPGFYFAKSIDEMKEILTEYSKIIYDYTMSSNRTTRENFGYVSMGL